MNFDWNSIWSDVETFTFNRSIGKTTLSYISVLTRVGISFTKNKICNFSQITNSAASINSMLRCFYEFFATTDKQTPFLQKESWAISLMLVFLHINISIYIQAILQFSSFSQLCKKQVDECIKNLTKRPASYYHIITKIHLCPQPHGPRRWRKSPNNAWLCV